jgi:hypothetical protein
MALTAEQQAQLEVQLAFENARHANQLELETLRAKSEAIRVKLDAIRLAKETLIENARSKPVDSRDVAAADIQVFAQTLVSYINE